MIEIDWNSVKEQLLYDAHNPLLFNNGFFVYFLSAFILLYYIFRKNYKHRAIVLSLFSLYFFYKASGSFVSIVILSAFFNYGISNWIFKIKKKGTIINVNSISGVSPDHKDPDYAAAKYALRGYSDSIASEAFKENIKIINLYPRAMATGMNFGRPDFHELMDPDEIAEFVVMMTKSKSFYISSIQFDRIKS